MLIIWTEELTAVILGGALGSLLRFLFSRFINDLLPKNYPWGIWVVNIVGCLVMGVIAALFLHKYLNSAFLRTFIMIGLLGGFTTFSSFSLDSLTLIQSGQFVTASLYILSTVILSIVATVIGFTAVSAILS